MHGSQVDEARAIRECAGQLGAHASASRVLPAPAGPVRVSRRTPSSISSSRLAANSAVLPISGADGSGTLFTA